MALIFKIVAAEEWRAAAAAGVFLGSAVDRKDGYIHFSTAAQAPETAAKWFAGRADLVARRGRGRRAGAGAALGAVARRRALSSSLWRAAARRGRLGAAAAA